MAPTHPCLAWLAVPLPLLFNSLCASNSGNVDRTWLPGCAVGGACRGGVHGGEGVRGRVGHVAAAAVPRLPDRAQVCVGNHSCHSTVHAWAMWLHRRPCGRMRSTTLQSRETRGNVVETMMGVEDTCTVDGPHPRALYTAMPPYTHRHTHVPCVACAATPGYRGLRWRSLGAGRYPMTAVWRRRGRKPSTSAGVCDPDACLPPPHCCTIV